MGTVFRLHAFYPHGRREWMHSLADRLFDELQEDDRALKDDALDLTPPIKMTLEQALEFIDDDELVEVTPASIRIRKKYLKEHERKRESRAK